MARCRRALAGDGGGRGRGSAAGLAGGALLAGAAGGATLAAAIVVPGALGDAAVHPLLELLADLEEGQALLVDGDGHAGLRVAALVGLVAPDLEAAEAADLDPLAPAQSLLQALEDGVHEQLGLPLGQLLVLAQPLDEVRLRHA